MTSAIRIRRPAPPCWSTGRGFRQARLRSQARAAHDPEQPHVPVQLAQERLQRTDEKYFSHANTRLLSAEQLLDAICRVTSVAEKFAGLPAGTRATQLPSPDVDNYFLKVFGQPARETACQCERSSESNLSQALQMINGPLVHSKVRDEKNRLRTLGDRRQNRCRRRRRALPGRLVAAPPAWTRSAPRRSTSRPAATACAAWKTSAGPC